MHRFAIFFLALVAAGCAPLVDESMLFRARPAPPERYAAIVQQDPGVEEVNLVATDGTRLHGILKRAPDAAPGKRYPLVIVFGGVARETSWMATWGEKPGAWGWLMVNYRGYGLSQGRPSEQLLLDDARVIYDWAAARPDVDAAAIVILGRSLGSFVAVSLASQRPARAVILATPFDSMAAIAEQRYPLLPMRAIVAGRYDAAALAPRIEKPALFVLAEADDVTPIAHGEALARAWAGPKKVVTLPATSHRMLEWRPEYWHLVGEFLGDLVAAQRRLPGSGMVQK